MTPPPPTSTLFPYTTLFRSRLGRADYPVGKEGVFENRNNRLPEPPWPIPVPPSGNRRSTWRLLSPSRGRLAGLRSEEHTSELQSRFDLVCRLLLEKKKITCR